jgi:hypothetical protein
MEPSSTNNPFPRGILNAGMVNATAPPGFSSFFSEFWHNSGPIPGLQNPFNYIADLELTALRRICHGLTVFDVSDFVPLNQ